MSNTIKLNSKLGYFDLIMIVVSLVIGMGIFRTPVNVANEAITPSIFFAAWIFGGIMALTGALTFAEIGSRLPVSGGYFRIFSQCYHPAFAFMLNGTILISNAASVAGVALIGAEYICDATVQILNLSPIENLTEAHITIAAVEIILFLGLNLLGLKTSATTQNILTVFKLTVVAILIAAVLVPVEAAPAIINTLETPHTYIDYLKSFGLCLIPIAFTYGGYQQTINFGGDISNANKILPKGIISGILLVIVLYLAINYAYFKVIGFDNLKSAESIASIMATRILGDIGSKILTMMLIFSVLAYVNVGLMSNPRVICAMSEDGTIPPFFSRYSKRFNVPVTSLITFTGISVLTLFFAKSFDVILNYVIFIDSIGFIAAAATLFILRKRENPDRENIYKMKFYPWIPLIFILSYAFVTYSVISASIDKDQGRSVLYGLCFFIGFLPLYLLFIFLKKRSR